MVKVSVIQSIEVRLSLRSNDSEIARFLQADALLVAQSTVLKQ